MSRERSSEPSKAQLARRAARELAVQGLYQWQMTSKSITTVEAEFRSQVACDDIEDHENWHKVMEIADLALFHELLHNVVRFKADLDASISPLLDRKLEELDPIELAILRLGAYELSRRLEVPYRVVINEGVELAKSFGATDGHKYVNGILDKLAGRLRSSEVAARRR
ncbi:transcription antitermination factor NusB [Halomonas urumqiensis]|uniref:Transcription antitermination protein NusB n=1 Tax=Halomonas urumqiensis TaxID=1684789 RepID=A0A2N7UCA1_9GAMM|nr:transcription antitermination factor NusB [Halomonas urumqiensis]PMR78066.1 transcription antitermination factor NusB [Halomonas urumqiensis]PTB03217.1 transcription antitermination factor NusB [Halomonas urumqiensis]GHE20630.1 N utilization substance protein B [Halomonas urumqiensis]